MADGVQWKISQLFNNGVAVFDGAVGSEIYKLGFFVNVSYENLSLAAPAKIKAIHTAYLDSGADVLTTNSYAANRQSLSRYGLADKVREINIAAVELAREAIDEAKRTALIAGSISSLNHNESIDHKTALDIIQEQAAALIDGGCDFLMFETTPSRFDAQIALEVAAACRFPAIVSFAVNARLELADRTNLQDIYPELLNNKFIVALGLNCIIGPEQMLEATEAALKLGSLPLLVQPNSGAPREIDHRMLNMCSPEYFTTYALRYLNLGVKGIGGCCGISPAHIREAALAIKPLARGVKNVAILNEKTAIAPLPPVEPASRSKFAAKLGRGEWVTEIEITPPRGFDMSDVLGKAQICKDSGIDAINLPDGPRASSRIATMVAALEIQEKVGIEVVLHLCCRDKNLIGLQADLLGCSCKKLNNILFITGDPPKLGDFPFASGVFDVDSIGLLKLANQLNHGIDASGKRLDQVTTIFPGAGADPNALDLDRELERLRQKVEAGAEYIITQPVFEAEALIKFIEKMRSKQITTPLIAGVWPLGSLRNAEFMRTEVPGVVIPDEIMLRMGKSPEKELQRAEGIAIAIKTMKKIRPYIQGIQVSAPFGNVKSAISVIKG